MLLEHTYKLITNSVIVYLFIQAKIDTMKQIPKKHCNNLIIS